LARKSEKIKELYCIECREITDWVVIHRTASAEIIKCKKCGKEEVDFDPLII